MGLLNLDEILVILNLMIGYSQKINVQQNWDVQQLEITDLTQFQGSLIYTHFFMHVCMQLSESPLPPPLWNHVYALAGAELYSISWNFIPTKELAMQS